MMNFIRQKLSFLMWFVAIAFVGGLFLAGGRSVAQNWLANIMPVSLLVAMPGCARSAGIIMRVGNYSVEIDELKRVKEHSIENARRQYGDNFDNYARNMDFDQEAIESITRYALLLQEADRHNIYISKAELDEGIREFPYLTKQRVNMMPDEIASRIKFLQYYSWAKTRDGKFNPGLFKFLLEREGKTTPEDFSKEVENGLRIARLKEMLYQSALVTDLEIQEEYRKENEKAKIKYIELQSRSFTDELEIDDAELSDYFQKNMLNYKTSDKVSISFIKIDPKVFENKIKINDAEVASYYKAHKEQDYFEPEQVKARHILVSADATISDADKAKAKNLAEEILKEAKKPDTDFIALAEKHKEEPFEVKHEDLGFFERGKMIKSFEEAAFALSPGEVSDVVETSYGYHVIKLESKKPAQTQPLERVKGEIIKKLKEEEAKVRAREKADDIQYAVMSEQDLQAAVDANPDLNLKIQETGLFAKNDFIPNLGSAYTYRDVAEEAFSLKIGELSNLVEAKSYGDRILGYFIFKLIDKKAGGLPTFEDVKSDVTKDLKKEKALKLAAAKVKEIMAARGAEDDLDEIAKKNELEVSESEPFTISARGYIRGKPSAMNSKEVMLKAFGMNVGDVAGPFEGLNGVYIVELVEREAFDEEKFAEDEEQRNNLRNQLLGKKKQKIYNTWYQKVRSEATVRSFIPASS